MYDGQLQLRWGSQNGFNCFPLKRPASNHLLAGQLS